MFLNNKYTKCYYNIINNAKSREIFGNYSIEKHHIIPKSLGGTNDKSNLVKLTPREHFVCHQLLLKMLKDNSKMLYALWRMCNSRKKNYKITSRIYEQSRKEVVKVLSERIVSLETKKKQSESKKLTHNTPEFKQLASLRAKNRTPEHSAKIGVAHKGKIISIEMRSKQSEKLYGSKNPRALVWKIHFENGSNDIIITSLKTWCLENNISYGMLFRTAKVDKFYQGLKAIRL